MNENLDILLGLPSLKLIMLTSLATGDLWMIMQLFLETSPGMSAPLMRLWLLLTAKRTIITTPVTVQVEIKFKKGEILTKDKF